MEVPGRATFRSHASGPAIPNTGGWKFESVDPATGQPFEGSFSAQIRNGDELWMVIQDGENLRVINRSVKAMGFEQVGFSLGTTLEETLAHFKICEGGATASDGDAVAGRSTFRIDCAAESASVWVDKEWFVPLKHELKGRESISSDDRRNRFWTHFRRRIRLPSPVRHPRQLPGPWRSRSNSLTRAGAARARNPARPGSCSS